MLYREVVIQNKTPQKTYCLSLAPKQYKGKHKVIASPATKLGGDTGINLSVCLSMRGKVKVRSKVK